MQHSVYPHCQQIGTVNAKAKDRIESARKAYDALSEAQKAYVANLTTLETAETSLSKLEFSIAKATVSSLGSYRYSGTALTPSFTVSLNGVKLVQDLDYSVTYLSNKNDWYCKSSDLWQRCLYKFTYENLYHSSGDNGKCGNYWM